jgi:hypothetical protein
VVFDDFLVELAQPQLAGEDSSRLVSNLVLLVLQQSDVDDEVGLLDSRIGLKVLNAALPQLLQLLRPAELLEQSQQQRVLAVDAFNILEHADLQEMIVGFLLYLLELAQKSSLRDYL